MTKNKLIRDLPFQKADDTEWNMVKGSDRFRFNVFDPPSCLDEKYIDWPFSWGDPLTSGWFEEVKPKRWKPEINETIFIPTMGEGVCKLICYDKEALEQNKLIIEENWGFRTEEQAKEAFKRIKKLLAEYQEEINKE